MGIDMGWTGIVQPLKSPRRWATGFLVMFALIASIFAYSSFIVLDGGQEVATIIDVADFSVDTQVVSIEQSNIGNTLTITLADIADQDALTAINTDSRPTTRLATQLHGSLVPPDTLTNLYRTGTVANHWLTVRGDSGIL